MKKVNSILILAIFILISFGLGFYMSLLLKLEYLDNGIIYEFESTEAIELSKTKTLIANAQDSVWALKMINSNNTSAKLELFLWDKEKKKFVKIRSLKLKEKYKNNSSDYLVDDDNADIINLGSRRLRWSAPDWIYYDKVIGLNLIDEDDAQNIDLRNIESYTYIR